MYYIHHERMSHRLVVSHGVMSVESLLWSVEEWASEAAIFSWRIFWLTERRRSTV